MFLLHATINLNISLDFHTIETRISELILIIIHFKGLYIDNVYLPRA